MEARQLEDEVEIEGGAPASVSDVGAASGADQIVSEGSQASGDVGVLADAGTRIGGCRMPASLLEILPSIPDHRRAEGKRFDLATVLLYSILGMVAGANSYRQMHEFIRIHLQGLNGAFGLRLPYSPSYTGLRLIVQGVDPAALEAAFRQHASSISAPTPSDGLSAIAVDGKTVSTPSATARPRT